jgi:two-component system, NarL family, sensor histidine kinase DevS
VNGERDHRDLLLEAGLALSSERSLPAILQRIVELATQLTGARYGAIGVLGPDGGIAQFITTGVTPAQRAAIGHLPVGKGVLGVLIGDARPLRLRDLGSDPRSAGFPPNHPRMRSFLGAAVSARGRVFGNIYLTNKQHAEGFDADDERALVILAAQAGVAVENAHLNQELEARVQRLDALHAIGTAMVRGDDPDLVTGLVARQAGVLLRADLASVAVPTPDREHLVVRAAEGAGAEEMMGEVFPLAGSVSGDAILGGRVVTLADAAVDERVAQPIVRSGRFGPALFVPLAARGEPFGTLLLARHRGGQRFDEGAVRLAGVFAGQAAVVLEQGRLQHQVRRLQVLEDRERIARELHDGTIQSLFTVGLGLQGTASLVGEAEAVRRIEAAVGELDRVIQDLRSYIFGLQPGGLATEHLGQTLEEMVDEFGRGGGVVAIAEIDPAAATAIGQHSAEVVQLVREALSNVSRHAGAATCRVSLYRQGGDAVWLEVDDDGRGFDPVGVEGAGRGLGNLRARAARLGGRAEIASVPGQGTTVRVAIPAGRTAGRHAGRTAGRHAGRQSGRRSGRRSGG